MVISRNKLYSYTHTDAAEQWNNNAPVAKKREERKIGGAGVSGCFCKKQHKQPLSSFTLLIVACTPQMSPSWDHERVLLLHHPEIWWHHHSQTARTNTRTAKGRRDNQQHCSWHCRIAVISAGRKTLKTCLFIIVIICIISIPPTIRLCYFLLILLYYYLII